MRLRYDKEVRYQEKGVIKEENEDYIKREFYSQKYVREYVWEQILNESFD